MRDKFLHIKESSARLVVQNGPTLTIHKEQPKIITVGIQGPQGEPGRDGVGDATYVHTQNSVSSIWTVTHNLNKKPSVTVVDSADSVVVGAVVYIDDNNLTIVFSVPFSGRAYIN